jgi:carbon starvation protein
MNAIPLMLIALCVLALGYRYYAAFIAAKVLVLDNDRVTPAHEKRDGHDYVPMNRWVLFGHHFAAIAGAGPLIGPVLAAQYGFLPGVIWILLGSVFAGAVHDLIILFASVRYKGQGLYKIAGALTGPVTGTAAALATLFIIIVSLAGLAVAVVNALKGSPWAFFTVAATIPIAILIGLYMFVWRPGRIAEGSAIGITLLFLAVIGGAFIANSPLAPFFTDSEKTLKIMLPCYGFVAAVLPVWLLLAPRDYLSTYMKIGTIMLIAVGVIVVNPRLSMPAITAYVHGGGPIIPGPVWPYVCITIACGAISGFHALIGTGTTPKMVDREFDIPFIGYGAMVTESFVAIMALIAATVLNTNDYFAINVTAEMWQKLGLHTVDLPVYEKMVGEGLMHRTGGAVTLAVGMASIFDKIPGLSGIMKYWYHFAIMFEALFILTTIDAGTRVARYILSESLGHFYQRFEDTSWIPGVVGTALAVSFAWGSLLYGEQISTIWPMFGVANQLLASIALAIGTTLIIRMGKGRYAWVTLVPFAYVATTTITAGINNILHIYMPRHMVVNTLLSIFVLILAAVIIIDSIRVWIGGLKAKGEFQEGAA